MRREADGRSAPKLALSARPAHRCLRSPDESIPRLTPETLTPRALGYRMPAEWETHEATWLAWPHNRDDWPGRFDPIPWVYGEIIRKLSAVERVRILIKDENTGDSARRILTMCGADWDAIEFFEYPTDRVWTRDFGDRKSVV